MNAGDGHPPAPAASADRPAPPDLPDPVRVVLEEAAAVVADRPAAAGSARLTATADGVRSLLVLLTRSAGLRTATSLRPAVVALELPRPARGADFRQVAANLAGTDAERAADGAATVTEWLDAAAQAGRRARREARRASRPSAAERAERRQRARMTELRAARDRAAARVETYRKEAADLREQVAALGEEVTALRLSLAAANTRLEHARRAAADPARLAESLAALIVPAATEATPDGRAVQAGEPPRVDPGRRRGAEAPAIGERLLGAAARTRLPEGMCATVRQWLPALLSAFAAPAPPRITVGDDLAPAVDILGGGTEIGGSCVLISAGGTRILIDAGTRPGGTDEDGIAPPRISEALSAPLDAVVVTHAHNDHGGWVPAILRRQPDVPVFVTDATADLLATMWVDAAKVLARNAAGASRSEAGLPPYGMADVSHALEAVRSLPYGRGHRVGAVELELFPAGHIVGAAGVVVGAGGHRVVISGDVSGPGQRTVGGVAVPGQARGADLLLLESTYAGQGRTPPRSRVTADLVRDVADVIDGGGRVLIPAFALGRAQEIALILAEHLPGVEVLVDGLAREVCEVYERHDGPHGGPLTIFAGNVRPVERGVGERERETFRSGVVIATSGMLAAGPAVGWARRILPDPRSAVMIVGYQAEGSPGRRLLDLAARGGGTLSLPRAEGSVVEVPVAARVEQYRLGAHASADELTAIAAEVNAAEVMLVHGRRADQEAFAGRLALRRQRTVTADRRWSAARVTGSRQGAEDRT